MIKSIEEERQPWIQVTLKASPGSEGRSGQRQRHEAREWPAQAPECGESFLKSTYSLSAAHCIHIQKGNGFGGNPHYGGVGVMVSVLLFCSGSLITNEPLPNNEISISSSTMPGHLPFAETML
uniref:Uncharacterized protein n=1 Tax=Rousettus aegyptiacus TaxID=9407 RepID=A0A7J8BEB4_ROUAE|nr:hypothetical protein HJG63_009716 [Rousettus aegyptiacus]